MSSEEPIYKEIAKNEPCLCPHCGSSLKKPESAFDNGPLIALIKPRPESGTNEIEKHIRGITMDHINNNVTLYDSSGDPGKRKTIEMERLVGITFAKFPGAYS